jgi:hypothetical protein
MVKHIVLGASVAAVISSVSVLSVHHYNVYRTNQDKAAVATAKAHKTEVQTIIRDDQQKYGALVENYNKSVAECQKGAASYAQVPPVAKTKLALSQPNCPQPIGD